jgi:hypothetical protein
MKLPNCRKNCRMPSPAESRLGVRMDGYSIVLVLVVVLALDFDRHWLGERRAA